MKKFSSLFEEPVAFNHISLSLASPEEIRAWSFGEVKVAGTFDFRTQKPKSDGLFCAKIFGPLRDYECLCGKYRPTKIGQACEKCEVEFTTSQVRHVHMGHIELASPVAHPLFFKRPPSHIGLLLNMAARDIEQVLYCKAYVVIDSRRTPLEPGQMLTPEEFQHYTQEYHGDFKAGTGGEGLRDCLRSIDLGNEAKELHKEMSGEKKKRQKHIEAADLAKMFPNEGVGQKPWDSTRWRRAFNRLKLVENLRDASVRPEWMVLEALPVLPPALRPMRLEDGRIFSADLNTLYCRVISRNDRLRHLTELSAPMLILNNEKRLLQEAVDALVDNERCNKPFPGSGRPLKSLTNFVENKMARAILDDCLRPNRAPSQQFNALTRGIQALGIYASERRDEEAEQIELRNLLIQEGIISPEEDSPSDVQKSDVSGRNPNRGKPTE